MQFGGFFRERPLYERRWAVRGYRGLRSIASRLGFHVVLNTFYSPIPELREVEPAIWTRRSELPGVTWDLDAQLAFVERALAEPMAEFDPPQQSDGPWRYARRNPSYSPLDAAVLYGMIRHLRPARAIELGSGQSTLVTAEAGRRNASEGAPLHLEAYDPYPAVAGDGLPGLARLHRLRAQDVPLAAFASLEAGDVLFVDTTHTVKLGSDVNFIVLEVLPRLAPGVVVHLHDIFLPYEYPRHWVEDFGLYWNEQYLVNAFLALNREWEVLCGVAGLARDRADRLAAAVPGRELPLDGSALWLRRAGG